MMAGIAVRAGTSLTDRDDNPLTPVGRTARTPRRASPSLMHDSALCTASTTHAKTPLVPSPSDERSVNSSTMSTPTGTKLAVTTTHDSPAGGEEDNQEGLLQVNYTLDTSNTDSGKDSSQLNAAASADKGKNTPLTIEKEIALSQLEELEEAIKVRKVSKVDGRKVRWIEYRARKAEEEKNNNNPTKKKKGRRSRSENDEEPLGIRNNNNSDNLDNMKGEVISTPSVLESMKLQFLQGTENIESPVTNGSSDTSLHKSPDTTQKRKSSRTRKSQSTPKENKEVKSSSPKGTTKGTTKGKKKKVNNVDTDNPVEKGGGNLKKLSSKNSAVNGSNEILTKIENVTPNDVSIVATLAPTSPCKVISPAASPNVDEVPVPCFRFKSVTKGLREIRKLENGELLKSGSGADIKVENDHKNPSTPLLLTPSPVSKSTENTPFSKRRSLTPKKMKSGLSKSMENLRVQEESYSNGIQELKAESPNSTNKESIVRNEEVGLEDTPESGDSATLQESNSITGDENVKVKRRGRPPKRRLNLLAAEGKSSKKIETVIVDVHNTMNGEPQTPVARPLLRGKKGSPSKKASGGNQKESPALDSFDIPTRPNEKRSASLGSISRGRDKSLPRLETGKKLSLKKGSIRTANEEIESSSTTSSASPINQTPLTPKSKSSKHTKGVIVSDPEGSSGTHSNAVNVDSSLNILENEEIRGRPTSKPERSLAGRVIKRGDVGKSPDKESLNKKGSPIRGGSVQKASTAQRSISQERNSSTIKGNQSKLDDYFEKSKVKSKLAKPTEEPSQMKSTLSGEHSEIQPSSSENTKKVQKYAMTGHNIETPKTVRSPLLLGSKETPTVMENANVLEEKLSELDTTDDREFISLKKNNKSKSKGSKAKESLIAQDITADLVVSHSTSLNIDIPKDIARKETRGGRSKVASRSLENEALSSQDLLLAKAPPLETNKDSKESTSPGQSEAAVIERNEDLSSTEKSEDLSSTKIVLTGSKPANARPRKGQGMVLMPKKLGKDVHEEILEKGLDESQCTTAIRGDLDNQVEHDKETKNESPKGKKSEHSNFDVKKVKEGDDSLSRSPVLKGSSVQSGKGGNLVESVKEVEEHNVPLNVSRLNDVDKTSKSQANDLPHLLPREVSKETVALSQREIDGCRAHKQTAATADDDVELEVPSSTNVNKSSQEGEVTHVPFKSKEKIEAEGKVSKGKILENKEGSFIAKIATAVPEKHQVKVSSTGESSDKDGAPSDDVHQVPIGECDIEELKNNSSKGVKELDSKNNNNENTVETSKNQKTSEMSTKLFYTNIKSKSVLDNEENVDDAKYGNENYLVDQASIIESETAIENASHSGTGVTETDLEHISESGAASAGKSKEKVPRILKQLFQDEGVQNMLKSMGDETAAPSDGSPNDASIHKLRPKRPTEPMLASSPELDGVVDALFPTNKKRKRWSEVDNLYMDEGVLNLLTSIDPHSRRVAQDDASSDISQASSVRSVKTNRSSKSSLEVTSESRKRKLSGASTVSNSSTKSMQPPEAKKICLDPGVEPQDPYDYVGVEEDPLLRREEVGRLTGEPSLTSLPKKKGRPALPLSLKQKNKAIRMQLKIQKQKQIKVGSRYDLSPREKEDVLGDTRLQEAEMDYKSQGDEEDVNLAELQGALRKEKVEDSVSLAELKSVLRKEKDLDENLSLAKLAELKSAMRKEKDLDDNLSLATLKNTLRKEKYMDDSVSLAELGNVLRKERAASMQLEDTSDEMPLAELQSVLGKEKTDRVELGSEKRMKLSELQNVHSKDRVEVVQQIRGVLSKDKVAMAQPSQVDNTVAEQFQGVFRKEETSSSSTMDQEPQAVEGQFAKSIPPLKIRLPSDSVTISPITKPDPKKQNVPVTGLSPKSYPHPQSQLQPKTVPPLKPQLQLQQKPLPVDLGSISSSNTPQVKDLREPMKPSTSSAAQPCPVAQPSKRMEGVATPAAGLTSLVRSYEFTSQGRGRPRIGESLRQSQRASVRQSEANYHYRDIALRKFNNFTQIILSPSTTKMKNSLNSRVLRELCEALNYLKRDDTVRMVLLTATGPTFCQGIDLTALQHPNLETRKKNAENLVRGIKEFLKTLVQFPKPIVAGVNGNAMGLGVTMLPLFDLVIANDKAEFYLPYSKLGQVPEGGATYTFPNIFGKLKSTQLFLGHKVTASMALEMGLASESIWPATFQQELIPKVALLATQSAQSMEATKALMNHHLITKLELSLESECRLLLQHWMSPHFAHLCKRFLDSHHIHLQKPVNLPL